MGDFCRKKLNQEDIAVILGVGRTTYSAYERGERQMDYESLVKIANFYKVSLDYLFGRSDFPIHIESYTQDEIEFMDKVLSLYKNIKSKYREST